VLRLPLLEGEAPHEAAASPEALLAALAAVTDAAPAHFQAAVGMQLQLLGGGQPGPSFVQDCAQAARGRALRELTAPGARSAWAGRPSTFEFAVNIVALTTPAFKAAWGAGLQHTMGQVQQLLQE
jgi:hypothetical protein